MADRLRLGPREYYQDVTNVWVPRNIITPRTSNGGVVVRGPGVVFGASWEQGSDSSPIQLYDNDTTTFVNQFATLPSYADANLIAIGGTVWWGPNGIHIERGIYINTHNGGLVTGLYWCSVF